MGHYLKVGQGGALFVGLGKVRHYLLCQVRWDIICRIGQGGTLFEGSVEGGTLFVGPGKMGHYL